MVTGMAVTLTSFEIFQAAMIGAKRNIEAKVRRLPDRHGFTGSGWDAHIEGACGEIAVAKFLGLYWGGSVNTFKTGGDVSGLEVRTRSESHYDLIIRDNDPPDSIYILVIGQCPTYQVVGWVRGREGKRAEYRKTHGGRPGAYFVPQSALRPIEELREETRQAALAA